MQVTHSNYDTHNENFDFHLEQLGEFDRPFACLVEDLAASGMLEHTLIVVLSEFGRTPNINLYYWPRSLVEGVVGGASPAARFRAATCIGKTNANGTAVVDGQVDHGQPVPHVSCKPSASIRRRTSRSTAGEMPIADPASSADQGIADMSAVETDVKQTHVAKTLTHGAPLIACRFDPTGKFVFATSEDRTLVRWNLDDDAKVGYCRP